MPKKITIFSRQTCAPCQMMKRLMTMKGLTYDVIDVDENPEAMGTIVERSGYTMVPMTVITNADDSETVISGYNPGRLIGLLN